MPDPRSHVRPGQRLQIAAEQINFLNRLMRVSAGFGSAGLTTWAPGSNVILARNDTGDDLPRWGIVEIGGFLIAPTSTVAESQFGEMPCVVGVLPRCDADTLPDASPSARRIGVAVEPMPAGKCGRIVVSGVTQVRIQRIHNEHAGAKPLENDVLRMVSCDEYGAAASILWCEPGLGEKLALVTLAPPTGPVFRLGKTAAGIGKGTIGQVQVYALGAPLQEQAAVPAQYVTCVNKFADVPGGRWAMVGFVNGRWYIVAAEC